MAVTKKYEPVYLREEAMAPSPLSGLQTALRELTQNVASLNQEMSSLKWDSPNPIGTRICYKGTPRRTRSAVGAVAMNIYLRTVGGLNSKTHPGHQK